MIEHVYWRAAAASSVSSVLVATDDERILEAVRGFEGVACMTSPITSAGQTGLPKWQPGSDRNHRQRAGGEPLIEPSMIDETVEPLLEDPMVVMSTLRRRIDDAAELQNPNVTKVVVDRDGYALYFSRAAIPFTRDGGSPAASGVAPRRPAMSIAATACCSWPRCPTELERSEALEQLRALEHGIRILAVETNHDSIGVDTPEDRVRRLMDGALRA